MSGTGLGLVELATLACLVLVVLGMALAFVRMVLGPSLPDRVVGLDMLTVLMVAFAAVFAIAVHETAFLDVAIVLALVGFLGTVAFARYAERRTPDTHSPDIHSPGIHPPGREPAKKEQGG